MDKTVSPSCLYKKGEVIDDAEHIIFECSRWQSSCSLLTSIIETITAANIIGVMVASWKNWASVANPLHVILRLKKRDLEEHVGVPA